MPLTESAIRLFLASIPSPIAASCGYFCSGVARFRPEYFKKSLPSLSHRVQLPLALRSSLSTHSEN